MSITVSTVPARAARDYLEPLLTVADLERLLRVTRRTIARLCQAGELPRPLKIGGGNRWKADEIARFVEQQQEKGKKDYRHSGENDPGKK